MRRESHERRRGGKDHLLLACLSMRWWCSFYNTSNHLQFTLPCTSFSHRTFQSCISMQNEAQSRGRDNCSRWSEWGSKLSEKQCQACWSAIRQGQKRECALVQGQHTHCPYTMLEALLPQGLDSKGHDRWLGWAVEGGAWAMAWHENIEIEQSRCIHKSEGFQGKHCGEWALTGGTTMTEMFNLSAQ